MNLLPMPTIERLHQLLAGDNIVEGWILEFIQAKYGAKSLLYLTPETAEKIISRPQAFLKAVKKEHEPNIPF